MCECRDTLHLDSVHVFEGMVENTWSIDYLPPHIPIVEVTDEERFGGEGVRLNVDVRTGDLVDEGGFADVGVAADEEGAGSRVNGGQTGDVLPDLFKVGQGVLLAAHDCSHAIDGLSMPKLWYD